MLSNPVAQLLHDGFPETLICVALLQLAAYCPGARVAVGAAGFVGTAVGQGGPWQVFVSTKPLGQVRV